MIVPGAESTPERPGRPPSDAVILFDGKVVSPAYITVFHNGVMVHHRKAFIGRMAHARVGTYASHGAEEPLMLHNHGDRVRYRNLWLRKLAGYDEP